MAKLFKTTGVLSFLLIVVLFFYFVATEEWNLVSILSLVLSAILGLALVAVGDLMDRVDRLEENLNIYRQPEIEEDQIQQVTCSNCGKKYDMDYPKCPYCGHSGSSKIEIR